MNKQIILLGFILLSQWHLGNAQDKKGKLSGSFETINQIYKKDNKTKAIVPDDTFGSNSYLKLDYHIGKLTMGLQYEAYLPRLVGYDIRHKDQKIAGRYLKYQDETLEITVGNFYEQFGSGLIFRSYENRELGINNAIEGVGVRFYPTDYLNLKAIYGKQREFFEVSDGTLRGLDGTFDLAQYFGLTNSHFNLGGSWLSKYETYTGAQEDFPSQVNAYSARLDFGIKNWSLNAEFVQKKDDRRVEHPTRDITGNALLINSSYAQSGLGMNFTFRALKDMSFYNERTASGLNLLVNYLPAITKQHKYSLLNIYTYITQADGEMGAQFDLYKKFKKGSLLGGKYGTKLEINFSAYNDLDLKNIETEESDFLKLGDSKLYRDFNINLSKKFSKRLKTKLAYAHIDYNKGKLQGGDSPIVKSDFLASEIEFKIKPKHVLRAELQHLWTKQDKKNWTAGLLEYSIAPGFSMFVSDQYNYGDKDKIHYYSGGFGWAKDSKNLQVAYGRNREGLNCSGGVCRFVPAYTGLNISFSTSF